MKTFYIRDPQGSYTSYDGKVMYRPITGKQIHEFFKKDANRAKYFVCASEEEDLDEIWFEVDPAKVSIALRAKRREQYVRDQKKLSGIEEISLDDVCCFSSLGEPIYLLEVLESSAPSPEEMCLKQYEKEALYAAVHKLEPKDKQLIWALFLTEDPLKEFEYAEYCGIPEATVRTRKRRALEKLKRILASNS